MIAAQRKGPIGPSVSRAAAKVSPTRSLPSRLPSRPRPRWRHWTWCDTAGGFSEKEGASVTRPMYIMWVKCTYVHAYCTYQGTLDGLCDGEYTLHVCMHIHCPVSPIHLICAADSSCLGGKLVVVALKRYQ
ncbi:hypothetical protein L209DRAFT_530297 [Thermothelomyces heterothallicus CBS 203.75]